jgi:hydrogenase maturation protein HypF
MSIRVTGVVQGVGFRPFVWRLAHQLGCSGFVYNDSSGVTIEVQGPETQVTEFLSRLTNEAPSSSIIEDVVSNLCATIEAEPDFVIVDSRPAERFTTGVPPDISVCSDCLDELRNSANRRFNYPFINCTNCGPRFTIIESLPYDRQLTTMQGFTLCDACRQEYESPGDRRFHAEPNACLECGPKIWFIESHETYVDFDRVDVEARASNPHAERDRSSNVLDTVRERIAHGQTIAIKGVGGFHLACDATNLAAIEQLRRRKRRLEKPFAVMVADLETCELFARVSADEAKLLTSPQRPIVLLEKRLKSEWLGAVAPSNLFIGVMLAYSPLHYLLISPKEIWVMTSGNLSDESIAIDNADAWARLRHLADGFLFHNRPICVACDDSVIRSTEQGVLPIRRSRGYAPLAVQLHRRSSTHDDLPTVFATGGELKATVCLAIGSQAYLSQHIGDMGNVESQRTMEQVSQHLLELYRAKPDVIAADMHPGYLSVGWAERLSSELGIPLIKTQHHHAHAASLLAEHGWPEDKQIIACVFDGTGFGTDATIWGGEWLLASIKEFQRFGHLRQVPLPGGDACILRPARSALAHLYAELIEWSTNLSCVQTLTPAESTLLKKQLDKGINCPSTTSLGRLFDAVSALAGVRQQINYEGQAAIELESLAEQVFQSSEQEVTPYSYQWVQHAAWELHLGEMLRQVIADDQAGIGAGCIGAKFHQTMAKATSDICETARQSTGIATVGLTGGVFQNVLLTRLIRNRLEEKGFQVLTHSQVPPNDAGLALGQAAIARAQIA